MLISSPRTQNQPELNQGGRGRRGRDVDWGDVQWLVDRSDDQWRMFETRIVGIFTEQSGKLEKKLDAQEEKLGKKLDAQDKKLDAQEEKLGKKLDAQRAREEAGRAGQEAGRAGGEVWRSQRKDLEGRGRGQCYRGLFRHCEFFFQGRRRRAGGIVAFCSRRVGPCESVWGKGRPVPHRCRLLWVNHVMALMEGGGRDFHVWVGTQEFVHLIS